MTLQQTIPPARVLASFAQRKYLHCTIVGSSAVYAIFRLLTFPRWIVDDAYISFRYAYNLAHYGELNWNVGCDPVEGYTGVMLPLLMAPAIALGRDPALVSQILGFLGFLVGAIVLWRILVKLETPPEVRVVVEALFLVAPAFYTHVFAGLETMLFVALVLASYYALLQRYDTLLPILLLLTSLTRPEGVLLAVLFIGARCAHLIRRKEHSAAVLLKTAWLFVLPGGVYFAWRWSYYGYPLPNTFYVKAGGGHSELEAVAWFAKYVSLPLTATLLTFPTLARFRKFAPETTALAIFACALLALYSRSTLIMNYGYRFFMPLYPLSLIVLATFAASDRRQIRWLMLPFLLLAVQVAWCTTSLLREETEWIGYYRDTLAHEHVATAMYIKDHVPADEWVILNDTGVMPYLTQMKTVDSGALNDEFLAHTHDPAAIRAYLGSFHAAAVVRPWFESNQLQGSDPYDYIMDLSGYKLITSYKDPRWDASNTGFRVYLFLRKDLLKRPS